MVKNEKGFTLIELLAIVVLASVILAPLMQSLVSNVTTNIRLHTRRSSVSLAESAIYGFDKLSYTDLDDLLTSSTHNYLMFDSSNCDQLTLVPKDSSICSLVFSSKFNNVEFDDTQFKVYIYDYNISSGDQGFLTGAGSPIPYQEVKDVIGALTPSNDPNPGLLRITVWINYSDDPYEYTIVSGLLIGEWSDSTYGE